VGNLVCPASFDLGHHRNVTLLSVTEGDDKPAKYPVMFRAADAMLITKADLLEVLDDFNCGSAEQNLRNLANPAPVMALSAKTRQGFNKWISWLQQELETYHQQLARGVQVHPKIHREGHDLHASAQASPAL
jgi:hydrogenase nickel incorporation protein HypB